MSCEVCFGEVYGFEKFRGKNVMECGQDFVRVFGGMCGCSDVDVR